MKKMLSAILVLTLMIGVMAVTASAAGAGTVQFDPNVNEAQPGDTITVKLNVVSNPGVMFFSYTPIYDTARLELVSMEGKDSSWTCATKANWDGANDEAFTGNVVIKMYEGVAKVLLSEIKGAIYSTTKSKIGGLLIKDVLKGTLNKFDVTRYGGAPLLGLKSLVVKMHGSAKAAEVENAIYQCIQFHKEDITGKTAKYVEEQAG